MPAQPMARDQQVAGGLERVDQGGLGCVERSHLLVSGQRHGPQRIIPGKPLTDQARQVRRHGLDSHRSEVDQTG